MTEPERRKRSATPLDLLVIVVLAAALAAGAILAGRRASRQPSREGAACPRGAPERIVRPDQIGYTEDHSIPVGERVRGLAVGENDHVFVSIGLAVLEYAPDGTEVRRIELDTAARALTVAGGILYLGCGEQVLAADPSDGSRKVLANLGGEAFVTAVAAARDILLVADAGSMRLVWLGLDGARRGETSLPRPPNRDTRANVPSTYLDVAAAADGTFWATETGAFGVAHYDAAGNRLGSFGKGSEAIEDFGGCCNPTHVALAPDGGIVTVEKKPALVKVYRSDGSFACVVAGPGSFDGTTLLADVAVDSAGRVLVLDPARQAVRVFLPTPGKDA
ncbi:MAG: hypothetical protein JXR77_09350 [Lentisphaeria bacterium]|nr:hypothetical protein [Lentisphaeria bacterium]